MLYDAKMKVIVIRLREEVALGRMNKIFERSNKVSKLVQSETRVRFDLLTITKKG